MSKDYLRFCSKISTQTSAIYDELTRSDGFVSVILWSPFERAGIWTIY